MDPDFLKPVDRDGFQLVLVVPSVGLGMDRTGGRKPYALIEPGQVKIQRTRPGAVWMIAEAEEGKNEPLGYFKVGDRRARAVVPK